MLYCVSALLIFISCAPTNNPFDLSKTETNFYLKSSDKSTVSNITIKDTIGDSVYYGFNTNLGTNIDYIQIKKGSDTSGTLLLTLVKNDTLRSTDTVWNSLFLPDSGVITLTCIAYLRGGTPRSLTLTITVCSRPPNNPPKLSVPLQINLQQDKACSLWVNASDPDSFQVLTFSTLKIPASGSFNAVSRIFLYRAPLGFIGVDTVIFKVKDNGYPPLADSVAVCINVQTSISNHVPVWQKDTINLVDTVGVAINLTLSNFVTDPDGDTLAFTLLNGNLAGDTIKNGIYSFTPLVSDTGIFFPQIVVKDPSGLGDTETIHLVVKYIVAVNHRPVLLVSGGRNVKTGTTCTLTASASDSDAGQTLTYSMLKSPAGSAFNPGTGVFSWATTASSKGTDTAIFMVIDNGVPPKSDTAIVPITVSDSVINRPPKWAIDSVNLVATVETALNLTLSDKCADPDGDTLTFALLSGNPVHDTIKNSVYSFTPAASDTGVFRPQIIAKDPTGLSDTLRVHLTVATVSNKPVFTSNMPKTSYTISEGALLKFPVKATDANNDTVTCFVSASTTTLPHGTGLSVVNDTFQWQSAAGDTGNFQIKFGATNKKDTAFIIVSVIITHIDRAPVFAATLVDVNSPVGVAISFTVTATDPDGDKVTLAITGALPLGSSFASATGVFTWSPTAAQTGPFPITFTASDGTLTTTKTITITISNNPAPVFTTDPVSDTIVAGQPDSFFVKATGAGTLTYQWQHNGTDISAATNTVYKIAAASITDTGLYTCVASNDGGKTTSKAAKLTIQYKVNYDGNTNTGGSAPATVNYNYGATITVSGNTGTLVKTGYSFAGWNTKADGSGASYAAASTFTMAAGNVTLYAQWTLISYTITYNLNGGTNGTNPSTYSITTPAIALANPTYTGYIFAGWYDNSGLTGTAMNSIPTGSTGDKVFWAKWTTNGYSITYNLDGGINNASNPALYTVASATITLANPTKAGYTFGGWFDNAGLAGTAVTSIPTGSTGDKTFYAKWTINTYQLTVAAGTGGSISAPATSPATVNYGAATTITAAPSNGYSFVNWTVTTGTGATIASATSASTTVALTSGNATVTANFTPITYQLTVAAGTGGSITAPATSPATVNHGAATTITAAPSTGYSFVNWTVTTGTGATIASATSASTTVALTSGSATVTANFAPITYQLTVAAGTGGSISAPATSPATVNHGAATTITAAPSTGYSFDKWTVTAGTGATITSSTSASTTVTLTSGNATVTAQWTPNTYTVTFNGQSATVGPNPATKTVTVPATTIDALPTPPTKTSYVFAGWWTGIKGGGTEFTESTPVTSNITVYANWVIKDIDGNIYTEVTIGSQTWMVGNLQTTKYNDGTAISLVTDNTDWSNDTIGARCWYNNDLANYRNPYGALYNWFAVHTGKLAPAGWHVASDEDWSLLVTNLSPDYLAGGKLKEVGTTHWAPSSYTGATNEYGFTALPGGQRNESGVFGSITYWGQWWSSTTYTTTYAYYRAINNSDGNITRRNGYKQVGYSVRCVKD